MNLFYKTIEYNPLVYMTFYLSKILWLIINPFNIILFLILFGFVTHIFLKGFYYKLAYCLAFLLFIFSAVFPTGQFLIYQLEKKFHTQTILPSQIDGILILSGATDPVLTKEYNQIQLTGSVERLTESIQLMQRYPKAKVIFSGGSGSINNQELTHTYVARKFFEQQQVNTDKIIFESKSRNTYENILYSKKIAKPTSEENWLVVTSAFHMTRALNIGEKLNWIFIPYTVDYYLPKVFSWRLSINFLSNIGTLQAASHEWIGLIAYYLMERTSKIY